MFPSAVLLLVERPYTANDVTHSMLLDNAHVARSYRNIPKYRSYGINKTAADHFDIYILYIIMIYSQISILYK